mgnify:FL=1
MAKNTNIQKLLFAKKIIALIEQTLFWGLKIFFGVRPDKKKYSIQIPENFYSPWLNDNLFNKTYEKIKLNTFLDKYKLYELWKLLEQIKDKKGEVIEIGVWRGGSACLIAEKCKVLGLNNKIYAADTFQGLVKASDKDGTYQGGEHADTSENIVIDLAKKMNLDNLVLLKGIFPDETAHSIKNLKFKFCHIDVDIYNSAKDVFNWVWKKMTVGGGVVFDDYGGLLTDGVSKFVDELSLSPNGIIIHNLNGHAVIIKT